MTFKAAKKGSVRHPKTIGIVVGFAFGIAVSILLLFRLGGYFVILLPIGLAPIAVAPIIGALLARAGLVPSLRPISTIILAFLVATTPLIAGVVEIRLREAPFPIPDGSRAIEWTKYPWGERVLKFENPQEMPALYDRLVRSAIEAGWNCHQCLYQASTRTGHASFTVPDAEVEGPQGYLGLELWPGEKALYGSEPSELTHVRVFHDLHTRSPEQAVFGISVLFLAGILIQLVHKLAS
jgi:hypothetical protein